MTMAQLVALHTLAFKGRQNISALATGLHLGLSSTSHLVDQLVRKGFVLRGEDPEDRRQKRVQLSPAGQALVDHLQATRLAEFDTAFSTLDPALQHQLGELLERVVAELIPQTCCEEGP
jgi:DNA-binding MarR family transcriptional regulator